MAICRHIAIATLLLSAACAHAEGAADVFARYKAASGGAHWDALENLRQTGSLHVSGLDGDFEATQDLRDGRSESHYQLGAIEGANGYDGRVGWRRDPGGEVAEQDAPEALRRARTQAWLDAHGYWYPQRMPAKFDAPQVQALDGRDYDVVTATPEGGDPVVLWFDARSHLLVRVVQQESGDTSTTVCDDWREASGVRVPFHCVSDRTDTAGRTDPRSRTEIRVARVETNVAVADADFAAPEMAATARIDNAAGVTRIPFELWSNHLYARGSIDGKPARFLVDTGGSNLLTPAAAKKFGLQGEGKLAGRGVGDEAVDVAFAHAKQVRVGDVVLDQPVFLVMDLGALPAVEGIDCDGLVGYELFRRFGVTIDYVHHELVLAEPAKFAPPAGAHAVAFDLADSIPVIRGELDGVPARISIDTGSRVSLTLHAPFAREHGLVAKYHAAPEAVTGWGVGGASRGRPARFGSLRIGDLTIDGIAGDIYTGDKGAFAATDLSANLGGGVLRRFTVAFDYGAKKMYLAPNAGFDQPDEFDRSGLWLLGDGDGLKVVDVAIDSAAQRAGLKLGDRIVSIGGDKIAARRLPEWRERLRTLPAGTKLAIDYLRDGHAAKAMLVLADRIPSHWK